MVKSNSNVDWIIASAYEVAKKARLGGVGVDCVFVAGEVPVLQVHR